jgi:hypothetical protein
VPVNILHFVIPFLISATFDGNEVQTGCVEPIEEYNAPVNRIMLQNACAQSMENERLWIADVQAYICSHVQI